MQILVDEARCSGCRACELACAARRGGPFGTAEARIRVVKVEADGVDRPSLCRQCPEAPCAEACPTGAIGMGGGRIRVSADECIVCPACAAACPFDAVFSRPETGFPLICDLCDGAPACVERCVTGALSLARGGAGKQTADSGAGGNLV